MLPTVFWILEGYRKLYEVRLTLLGTSSICRYEREDLRYWMETDRRVALRVLDLIEAVMRDPSAVSASQNR